jgi:periplasmic protein TonB
MKSGRLAACALSMALGITACANQPPPTAANKPQVMLSVREHTVPGRTPVQVDPAHPVIISQGFYPDAARRAHQEGSCLVKLTVGTDGKVIQEAISVSSGVESLDQASLDAFRSARFIPATENGAAVVDFIEMPSNWRLR